MFNFIHGNFQAHKIVSKNNGRSETDQWLIFAASANKNDLLLSLGNTTDGLTENAVEEARNHYGKNKVTRGKKRSLTGRVASAFINPFTAILFCMASISFSTDIIWTDPGEADPLTVIIMTMVITSGLLRFVQETRSGNAAENLLKMIKTTTCVQRLGTGKTEIALEDVVVGDLVHLATGDIIPADLRIIQAKDLFISQAALTGESAAVERTPQPYARKNLACPEYPNLAFMGTNVISGSAVGVVIATGDATIFGNMVKHVSDKPVKTSLKKV